MTTVITLDQKDIRKIIAEHFNVLEDQVTVNPFITTIGHGYSETEVAKVTVEIRQS